MPSVSSDSSLGYTAMLPAHWMPQSDPTIPSFGDDEVKNGIQASHVASNSEKEHFRHKSNTVNELQRCYTPKKTGGVTVYGYRHYTPKTGQFLGRDPIEEEGGFNFYGFCYSAPLNFIDNFGREPISVTIWGYIGILAAAGGEGAAAGSSAGLMGAALVGGAAVIGTATWVTGQELRDAIESAKRLDDAIEAAEELAKRGKVRRYLPCNPHAGTTMFRVDVVILPYVRGRGSRPHKPFKGTHTQHYVVLQSGPNHSKPCFCEAKKVDVTDLASPRPGEIRQVTVTGGGLAP
jgi:RHS repeat-associated protein